MNISNALKHYRRLSRLTQIQVAERAGINEKYYGELERGESSPTINKLELISEALGVELFQMISYKQIKNNTCQKITDNNFSKNITHAYCNCCGTEFYVEGEVICPECGCEFNEENNFIEIFDV